MIYRQISHLPITVFIEQSTSMPFLISFWLPTVLFLTKIIRLDHIKTASNHCTKYCLNDFKEIPDKPYCYNDSVIETTYDGAIRSCTGLASAPYPTFPAGPLIVEALSDSYNLSWVALKMTIINESRVYSDAGGIVTACPLREQCQYGRFKIPIGTLLSKPDTYSCMGANLTNWELEEWRCEESYPQLCVHKLCLRRSDQSCTYDQECASNVCLYGKCNCSGRYGWYEGMCRKNTVDLYCEKDGDCRKYSSTSSCNKLIRKCECPRFFFWDDAECHLGRHLGETCEFDKQCSAFEAMSACRRSTCRCDRNYEANFMHCGLKKNQCVIRITSKYVSDPGHMWPDIKSYYMEREKLELELLGYFRADMYPLVQVYIDINENKLTLGLDLYTEPLLSYYDLKVMHQYLRADFDMEPLWIGKIKFNSSAFTISTTIKKDSCGLVNYRVQKEYSIYINYVLTLILLMVTMIVTYVRSKGTTNNKDL